MNHPYNFVEAIVLIVMGLLVLGATVQEHVQRKEHGIHFTDVLGLVISVVISVGCVTCGIIADILTFLK